MGILGMATADLQDLTILEATSNTSISSTYARTGTYSFKVDENASDVYIQSIFAATTEGYCRVAVLGTANIILRSALGVTHLTISLNCLTGALAVYRGGTSDTLLDSVAGVIYSGVFNVIEVHWTIDNSSGVCQVKLNGNQLINFSGDTQNGGVAEISAVRVSAKYTFGTTFGDCYVDDIMVRDDAWPGRGGIHVLVPDAGTSTEDWTASAGDPENCVDERPPSFSDYIYTDAEVDGTEHLFGMSTLPTASTSITGLAVVAKVLISSATDAYAHTLLYSGTTLDTGADTGVEVDATWLKTYYETNPDDAGAWEDADITAIQAGIETVVP